MLVWLFLEFRFISLREGASDGFSNGKSMNRQPVSDGSPLPEVCLLSLDCLRTVHPEWAVNMSLRSPSSLL